MGRDMNRRSARGNRVGLLAVGLLLMIVGLAALAAGRGVLGPDLAGEAIAGTRVRELLDQRWVPYAAVAVAFLSGFLALRWLLVQGMNDTVGRVVLDHGPGGRVEMSESVARGALEQEVAEYPGVRRARARLTESSEAPHLRLALLLEEDADVTRVWERVRSEALANLGEALDLERIPTVIRMSVAAPARVPRRGLA
ncbi:alkaline shock response membrane anchor protein AmaP [Nocardiopsis sp. EMB25]|uniref:alkaline shock response membrane anchor protein AmaP n=1 Tax=Nocardiopsis sp. EMB25 TaxID=2835867 RepID=UPI0022847C5E|nr:alkaline shock response membrane anchor protein AmaP [Nocardiopsis sp. EMB25]MCY9782375.1 alkaline shock response membrane anchor protein AmaP [Nocardiopsis sp. EMB25]